MHKHRRELVLELVVPVPDRLDLVFEPFDIQLSSQDLGRDLSAARVEILLELVVDVRRLEPTRRREDVIRQGGDGLGEGLLLGGWRGTHRGCVVSRLIQRGKEEEEKKMKTDPRVVERVNSFPEILDLGRLAPRGFPLLGVCVLAVSVHAQRFGEGEEGVALVGTARFAVELSSLESKRTDCL